VIESCSESQPPTLTVCQVAIGKFHQFHLARYLHQRGALRQIFCGYPWAQLKGESIPRELVKTYPWVQAFYMGLGRLPKLNVPSAIKRQMEWVACESLDRYAAKHISDCDAVVALSQSGLTVGRTVQAHGGKYICDRGSTHIRAQNNLLAEEYRLWNQTWRGIDSRVMDKEEAEYAVADYVTVPSEFNRQSFIDQGVSREKVHRITYGANVKRFQKIGGPHPEKFVVLYVGQVSLRKGIPYLLQAFNQFKHPKKELWVVGPITADAESILNRFPVSTLRLFGRVPNAKLAEIYSSANAFVIASIEEGLALVQGEALACGCPVIATENTGGRDLFDHGKEGFFVPIRDAQAIVDRLTQLADDPALWSSMSQAAVNRTRSIGGWDTYGEAYYQFLKEVTTVKATPPA
jgi:alpha-maltose-1-phosphate synthase